MSLPPTPAPQPSDPTAKQLQAKALARRHREGLRRRARRIRRTVVSTALALFTAAFVGIYVQMASGHDPALSAAGKRATAVTNLASSESSNTTSTGETSESGTSATGESGESSSTGESSSSASAVTTSQS